MIGLIRRFLYYSSSVHGRRLRRSAGQDLTGFPDIDAGTNNDGDDVEVVKNKNKKSSDAFFFLW